MNQMNMQPADNSALEVDTAAVEKAISANSHTILDVREQDEWNEAHIEQAIHIPLGELANRTAELPADKPVYTICRSGVRSLKAVEILQGAGLEGAKSLAGGVIGWYEAGKPLVR